MIKKCAFIMIILAAIIGRIAFFVCVEQKVRCITGINNQGHYYILEFKKMNRDNSYMIPVSKNDVFAVNFKINQGHADFSIAMDGTFVVYSVG